MESIADPLALRLDITLPETSDLLALNDLDNYLFPLAPRPTERTWRQFASVWATKRQSGNSAVAVCQAQPTHDPGREYSFEVQTTASASTTAYQQQLQDQITAARVMPDGGIARQLAFVVGPRPRLAQPLESHDRLARPDPRVQRRCPRAERPRRPHHQLGLFDYTASSTQPRATR